MTACRMVLASTYVFFLQMQKKNLGGFEDVHASAPLLASHNFIVARQVHVPVQRYMCMHIAYAKAKVRCCQTGTCTLGWGL